MRITRIEIKNWKNFRSVGVDLQDRAFIAGPNASGKSNFLDAIKFLHDLASSGGGLRAATSERGGISKIRSLFARQNPQIYFNVFLGDDENARQWQYELSITQDNNQRPIVKKEVVLKNDVVVIERPDEKDSSDRELLTQTHLEQVAANHRFREIYDFFGSID